MCYKWNCHHISRCWPVAWSAPSHNINQCCLVVDWPIFQPFSRKLPQKNRPSLVHIMACRPIGLHWLGSDTKDPRYSPVVRENNRWPWFPRTFRIVYYFASSVQLMTWILLHVLAFHPLERLRWSLAWISPLPMGLSPSYLFWWQLMWWVTADVAVVIVIGNSVPRILYKHREQSEPFRLAVLKWLMLWRGRTLCDFACGTYMGHPSHKDIRQQI